MPKQRKSTDLITENSGPYFKRREIHAPYPQHPDGLGELIMLPIHMISTAEPGNETEHFALLP